MTICLITLVESVIQREFMLNVSTLDLEGEVCEVIGCDGYYGVFKREGGSQFHREYRSGRTLGDAEVGQTVRGHLGIDVEHAVTRVGVVTADSLVFEGIFV